jgi:hypothetical protein
MFSLITVSSIYYLYSVRDIYVIKKMVKLCFISQNPATQFCLLLPAYIKSRYSLVRGLPENHANCSSSSELVWSWNTIFLFREIRNNDESDFNFAKFRGIPRNFVVLYFAKFREITENFMKISYKLFREIVLLCKFFKSNT